MGEKEAEIRPNLLWQMASAELRVSLAYTRFEEADTAAAEAEEAASARPAATGKDTFYPRNHVRCGSGISSGAVAAVRLPKTLVLSCLAFFLSLQSVWHPSSPRFAHGAAASRVPLCASFHS